MKIKVILPLIIVSFFVLFSSMAQAKTLSNHNAATPAPSPWFTGPLLAPSGHTIPAGHQNYELYLFWTDNVGFYNNSWQVVHDTASQTLSPTLSLSLGLTNFMDAQLIVPYDFNFKRSQSDQYIGDTSFILGFQILTDNPHSALPDLKVTVGEAFPSGRYDNLIAGKLGTDATGSGSFQTAFGLNFQKLIHLYALHFLRLRLSLVYTLPASTNVVGFNSYGGGVGTSGKVNPGNRFTTDLAAEYTLTQHWVLAMDALYAHSNRTTFSGTLGTTPAGGVATVGSPSGDQLSLAPAVEYNFTPRVGIIAGVWFSVTGKNAADFTSGVIALNLYN